MLISVCGSQGSGKSTLLSALSHQYPTIERKTSRSILSDWNVTLSQVNNDRQLTVQFQEEILARKISDEADAVSSTNIFLTERSYADIFVYALVAIGKDNEHSAWLDDYYKRCVVAQMSYSGLIYLAAGAFNPVDDGVRAINTHYSKMVDLTMEHYIQKMFGDNLNRIYNIRTPDMETRLALANAAIRNFTEDN